MGDRATLKVVLLGCGVVGAAVYRLLAEQSADLSARAGAALEVVGVAVRDPGRPRAVTVPPDLLTTDAGALDTRPGVDIVIELMVGIEPPRPLRLAALTAGNSVVTATKPVLASHSAELHVAARRNNAVIYYEAAVAR